MHCTDWRYLNVYQVTGHDVTVRQTDTAFSLAIVGVKLLTSETFREAGSWFKKAMHVITCSNIPTMYRDWDHENVTVEEHRRRYKRTETEMGCLLILLVNTVFSLVLLGPLWYTGQSRFKII